MMNFIKKLQAKPVHIRERIVYGTAAGITAVVGVLWFTSSLMTINGILSYKQPTKDSHGSVTNTASVVNSTDSSSGYLTAAAAMSVGAKPNSKPRLQVVNVRRVSTVATSTPKEKTVISF